MKSARQKKVIVADVDETICETCQVIEPLIANQISQMIKNGFTFAFISGTKPKYLLEMVSSGLSEEHYLLPTTGTKCIEVKADKSHKIVYSHELNHKEKQQIISALEDLTEEFDIISLTTKEDQIQDRGSQVTLSAIGRNAPLEKKKVYDPEGLKRKRWIKYLKTILSENEFDISIAGTTSIDITRKGLDKAWGIKQFARRYNIDLNSILFFGDKTYPGGNDYPATKIVDFITVSSPKDTLEKLYELENSSKIITDHRPWGKFDQFTHNQQSTVKILTVKPNKRLSLQSHENREELWVALDDNVITEIAGEIKVLQRGEQIHIPKKTKHRLSAKENEVRVLEISFGEFDEKDITRYEDDFNRA